MMLGISLILLFLTLVPYKRTALGDTFVIHYFLFRGRRIYQKNTPIHGASCAAKLKAFAAQNAYLADELPPGVYTLVTHQTILTRIKSKPNIVVSSYIPCKRKSLGKNLEVMCNCKKCSRYPNCLMLKKAAEQFYRIRIEKRG